MRFETDRPASWQVCVSCGNELTETDPRSRCPACGGLLEIAHRPPDLTRAELLLRFTERRGRQPGGPASGVWRFREFVLPSAEEVVSHPGGQHAAAPPRGARPVDRHRRAPAQARGPQPHRLVQGPGHDRRRHPGAADRRARGRLRVHRQHLRLARGLRGPGGDSRAGAGPRGQRRARASWPSRSPTARAPCWCAAGSTTASAWCRRRASGSASTCSTRSIRSGSRARRPSCSSCSSSWPGIRPTGSCFPPATWGTPPPSGKRCGRRSRGG